MSKSYGIIYKATNKLNGKCYIGQTTSTLEKRQHKHLYDARWGSQYFYKAIRKYGEENFEWEILCECENKIILDIIETFKIMVNKSHVSEGGYNCTWGGDGWSLGQKHTEATLEKMRHPKTEKHRDNISKGRLGIVFSDETKKKMSTSQTGKIIPKQTIDKISRNRREYSDDIVSKTISLIDNGMTQRVVAKIMNISKGSVQYWCKKYKEGKYDKTRG